MTLMSATQRFYHWYWTDMNIIARRAKKKETTIKEGQDRQAGVSADSVGIFASISSCLVRQDEKEKKKGNRKSNPCTYRTSLLLQFMLFGI